MLHDPHSLAAMAETLASSGDYRILRRLVPRSEFTESNGAVVKTGILLDVETTGLDHTRDEIIELGKATEVVVPVRSDAAVRILTG